ncbi:ATP-dependent acyl-CoA ligase [Pollutimonas nitritireducens]|uniref:ATP-dependent acyl-CoA ligase n=1 Tax=Pollutimonas nitritireducens TaxID=2045209 RepID=A0A2N4UG21_9BURK|nr:AMP-binding protein [Pollutimonas nitritireducens]PLC53968.1 ATP-dependent acyl-CoA ligase [Pollutimonas nitritireducens]
MNDQSAQPLHFGFPPGAGLAAPSADPLPLAERVAAKILARQAKAAPDRPFLYFGGQWVSYSDADRRANRCANALAAAGVKRGDRVAIVLHNCLEYFDLWFGLSRLGAIQVPINVDYRAPQIAHTFRRSTIDAVVVEGGLLAQLEVALKEVCPRPLMLVLGGGESEVWPSDALHYADFIAGVSDSPPPDCEAVSGADVGAVMNTSGTTGPSKGVLVTHAQQYILGRMLAADMRLGPEDVYYNFFPLFHNTAQAMLTIPVLLTGARMVLTDRFSASRFWLDVREHRCTAFYYIGEIMRILLRSSTQADERGSTLRVAWGIGAAADDFIEFQRRFDVELRSGYGSTEANVPCYLPHGSTKAGSAGRVAPGFEVRIADEHSQPLPAGTEGEILVRASESCALMVGYDGDAAATVESWKHLWFHTGDTGRFDTDGELYFTGRIKDAIRVRGENVSAFEVELAFGEAPAVLEVAAIAVPCELGGDDLKIVVVTREGVQLAPEELVEFVRERLPRYAIPRYVEFVDALPKTPTNKVMKHELRAKPFTSGTWDRLTATRGS